MARARMIRKQVYLEERHEELLKRKAEQWQMSEAEVIRHALDMMPDSLTEDLPNRSPIEEVEYHNPFEPGFRPDTLLARGC